MAQPKKKPGRKAIEPPSEAKELEKIYLHCLLGATNDDVAKFCGVGPTTVDKWLKDSTLPFTSAVKRGREEADEKVVKSLFQRAIGYSNPKAVKIFLDRSTGEPVYAPYTEYYPPDTTAQIFWLKNRQRDKWRERQDDKNPNTANVDIDISFSAATGCKPLRNIEDIEREAAEEEEKLNRQNDVDNESKEA